MINAIPSPTSHIYQHRIVPNPSEVIQLLLEGEILPKPVESVKCMHGLQEYGCAIFPLPVQTHQSSQYHQ